MIIFRPSHLTSSFFPFFSVFQASHLSSSFVIFIFFFLPFLTRHSSWSFFIFFFLLLDPSHSHNSFNSFYFSYILPGYIPVPFSSPFQSSLFSIFPLFLFPRKSLSYFSFSSLFLSFLIHASFPILLSLSTLSILHTLSSPVFPQIPVQHDNFSSGCNAFPFVSVHSSYFTLSSPFLPGYLLHCVQPDNFELSTLFPSASSPTFSPFRT